MKFKNIFYISLLLLCGCATMKTATPEEAQYQNIILLPGMQKDIIYSKTLAWMAETYGSSKSVIELQDKENSRIIGHGVTYFTTIYVKIPCEYTVSIDIKDGKLRATFNNFIALYGDFHNKRHPLGKAYVGEVKRDLQSLSNSLKQYLRRKGNDEW
jgi:hypothetical protein